MNERLDYSAPKAEVLVVQAEGVICESNRINNGEGKDWGDL